MKYWVISDTHFGHEAVVTKEFCDRPKDHEDRILRNLSVVAIDDVFIHLGDICWRNPSYWHDRLWQAVKAKRRFLCVGNHDSNTHSWYYNHGWDFVGEYFSMNIFGKRILFSHVPMADHGYDLNIHGHFHNAPEERHEPELKAIKNAKHRLLAPELENLGPIRLRTLVEKFDRQLSENKGVKS